jgi:oxygen-independent coproporphyrinogen-3 oxidase
MRPAAPLWSPGDPPVGLYVHVPFCRALCTYCDFFKGEYETTRADLWLDGLEREIEAREKTTWSGRPVLDTVFVGGGTPSTLTPEQWRRLGELLWSRFEILPRAEVTSEANPESLDEETAAVLRGAGVNRLSLGAQSLDAGELSLLGRRHDAEGVERALAAARRSGFENVNLDLLYGLPGQSPRTFLRSLDRVLALEPEHLSAYCLGLEPGTPLLRSVEEGRLPRPDDAAARRMYERLGERCAEGGYDLYEISNFARPGRACRHNLRYWEWRDCLGLGPSSHGFLARHRWSNPASLGGWFRAYGEGRIPPLRPVPLEQGRFEWVFLHLRLTRGFREEEFAKEWGNSLDEVYGPVVRRLAGEGLLLREGGRVRLAPETRFVSDGIFSQFAPEG